MNRRSLVAWVIVASLSVSSVNAQSLKESIARAAEQVTAQQSADGKIPRGYLWSGVLLLAGGGAYLASAATMESRGSTCTLGTCVKNSTVRMGRFAIGGTLAGVGGFLLAKGISKSHQTSPSVSFVAGGGVVIGQRFSF